MALLLLVHINPKLVRKIRLTKAPETIEELYNELRQKLELVGEFCIQYEDSDFGQAVCNLIDIAELPSEKAVLHILWSNENLPSPPPPTPTRLSSISSLDTASIGSPDSIHSLSSVVQTYRRNVSQWPTPFPIPEFSYDVELILRKGNETFEISGKSLHVTRDVKTEILDKLAQEIFTVKAYPDKHEFESVAAELVNKHPCLKEPGGGTGYAGWTISIKYKMGNYRTKLRQAGCNEVGVNRRTRREVVDDHGVNRRRRDDDGDDDLEIRFSLKKPKRGEVNHVPDHPESYTEDDLEDLRSSLVEAMKKKNKDMEFISQKMDVTFSFRRMEIVEMEPMVSEVLERWPGLFLKEQICQEFTRVTTKDLMGTFKTALEMFTPRLLKLYRARKGAFREMETLLEMLDKQTSDITSHRRQTAVEGLPIFLRDNTEKLFSRCLATDADDEQTKGIKIGVLTVLDDDDAVINIAVVLEETIVLNDIPDTPTALAFLFGLLYALNMEFPKDSRYTFETIQHIFMEMSTNYSQRVRSFKTKLLNQ
ncbi:uncharacterized protein LOC105920388 [Fundulus heteroclitus]|uniref:uncharacterized protein LOC105920388 n=1 Tax=Fundulus heteroclitus TaxID=8078 RepID=UPI00165BC821|nr:uncharacterized protein LOC105920388 [Fundulus heteroclitus]XP_036006789.1 uncharacterized protein LOC105920388 [Fundulus heteroclitus]